MFVTVLPSIVYVYQLQIANGGLTFITAIAAVVYTRTHHVHVMLFSSAGDSSVSYIE